MTTSWGSLARRRRCRLRASAVWAVVLSTAAALLLALRDASTLCGRAGNVLLGHWPLRAAFATVRALHRYPVKSCLGEDLLQVEVGAAGLAGDRNYAVCRNGRALTQRGCPRLASITARLVPSGGGGDGDMQLVLSAPQQQPLVLAAEGDKGGAVSTASVFGADICGLDMKDEAASWISTVIEMDGCRLLRRADACRRTAIGAHWKDLAPLLIISEASLAALSKDAGRDVPMNRFRPNIVIAGEGGPHEEDTWRRVRVDGVELEAVGPCGRCKVVEVDQEAAVPDKTFSAYGALVGYREQAVFGQYFRPIRVEDAADNTIKVGSAVELLA